MSIFNFLIHFLEKLLTLGTFYAATEPCDVTGGTLFWKCCELECTIEFPTPKLVSKSIWNFIVLFLQKLLTLATFWASGEPCDVTGGTCVLKCFLVLVHHGIPHLKISLKVNLQPIPFSSKVINTWHFLGLRGTLWRHRWYLVLKSFFVRVHHRIPYPKFFSPPICNFLVHFLQKLLTLGTFYASRGTLWRHRWYLVLKCS